MATTDDTRFKVKSLLKLASITTDYCQRERYCREAKMLLDAIEPIVPYDTDVVMQFLNENYVITFDKKDRVLKREFDKAFLFWSGNHGFMLTKKEVTTKMLQLGIRVNARGCYEDKHGVYVYEGIKSITAWQPLPEPYKEDAQ